MARVAAIVVGKWAVGYGHETERHILNFEFTNGEPITLSLSPKQAEEIAQALLNQVRNKPPRPDRLS